MMATVKPIKPEKPVDYVGYEPVMIAVSKARAPQHALAEALDEVECEYRKLGTNLLMAGRP
jgi:hypothetical protein